MNDLSSTTGIVALVGCGVGAIALVLAAWLALQLRRARALQRTVLGDHDERDLVEHAAGLEQAFRSLHGYVEDVAQRLDARVGVAEERLDGAIAYHGLVRYDAYNEMSGHQSTSIALLDSHRSGVVLSSIHHRDQARLYAKLIHRGEGELELSPEEAEAIRQALSG